MKPMEFPEQTKVLGRPQGMTEEECGSLAVWSDGRECISCWELSPEEIAELLVTKRIWLRIVSGHTQPPVLLQVEKPFVEPEPEG